MDKKNSSPKQQEPIVENQNNEFLLLPVKTRDDIVGYLSNTGLPYRDVALIIRTLVGLKAHSPK